MTLPGVESGNFGSGRRGLEVEDGVIWGRRYADDIVDPVADAVANALYWDLALPRDRVICRCSDGWVTLTGKSSGPTSAVRRRPTCSACAASAA